MINLTQNDFLNELRPLIEKHKFQFNATGMDSFRVSNIYVSYEGRTFEEVAAFLLGYDSAVDLFVTQINKN